MPSYGDEMAISTSLVNQYSRAKAEREAARLRQKLEKPQLSEEFDKELLITKIKKLDKEITSQLSGYASESVHRECAILAQQMQVYATLLTRFPIEDKTPKQVIEGIK